MKLIKIGIGILLIFAVVGCSSVADVRAVNRSNLNKLSMGMTKQEVLGVMGTETISAQGQVITNPYRTETYRSQGEVFELVFYYTDIQKQDGAITDDELTPLVIKDGQLDGWGWSYWNSLINKYEIRVR